MGRVGVIAWKELRQLRRDRLTFAMMTMLPVIQLLLFGFAINTDVRHVPIVIHDQDQTDSSRDLVRNLEATDAYRVVAHVRSRDEIQRALQAAKAHAALVIPAQYGAKIAAGTPVEVEMVLDGSDPLTVSSATRTAAAIVAARAGELALHRTGVATPITLSKTTWYNPELRTAVFVVPGLVGAILTFTMVMLTAVGMVRERERGTLEQLVVSPVKRIELVAGKILPYTIIGYIQTTLILAAGWVIFGVPFAGSLPLLYAFAFVFIAACLALGLMFSTLAQTQQQAMQMSFFFILPNILLSGFMFPFEAMPRAAQWIGEALPLTHFLRIVRGIALRGAGFTDLAGELLALAIILVVLLSISTLRFRKQLG